MFSEPELLGRFHFLQDRQAVAIAVSGGSDSLALLYLVARWQQIMAAKGAISTPAIHVLSVDHALRVSSGQETEQVMKHAKGLGLIGKTLKWDWEKCGARPQSALQEKARQARYRLCTDYCKDHDIALLLTGHQLEDQVETFLMRLARGGGIEALSAISAHGRMAGIEIRRPLLDMSKQQLKDYLGKIGQSWIEDPSNKNCNFERVRIRQNMDCLQKLDIVPRAVARSSARMARANEALHYFSQQTYDQEVSFDRSGVFYVRNALIKTMAEEIVVRLFRLIFARLNFSARGVELAQIEDLVSSLKGGIKRKFCLGGCEVISFRKGVYIFREAGRMKPADKRVALEQGRVVQWDNRFEVTQLEKEDKAVFIGILGVKNFAPFRAALKAKKKPLSWQEDMPSSAGASLLSFWQEGQLMAVPDLGYASEGFLDKNFLILPLISK